VTGLLIAVALVAALVATGARRWRRRRLTHVVRTGPGSSPEAAIPVRSYGEMDAHLARRCLCGGTLEPLGEGTRELSGRRLRVARLRCRECERVEALFFDTTGILH
jgi:hypothetical protein